MTKDQKAYVATQEKWQKNARLIIEEVENEIINNKRVIDINERMLANNIDRVKSEKAYLQKCTDNYNKWLRLEGLD